VGRRATTAADQCAGQDYRGLAGPLFSFLLAVVFCRQSSGKSAAHERGGEHQTGAM